MRLNRKWFGEMRDAEVDVKAVESKSEIKKWAEFILENALRLSK